MIKTLMQEWGHSGRYERCVPVIAWKDKAGTIKINPTCYSEQSERATCPLTTKVIHNFIIQLSGGMSK